MSVALASVAIRILQKETKLTEINEFRGSGVLCLLCYLLFAFFPNNYFVGTIKSSIASPSFSRATHTISFCRHKSGTLLGLRQAAPRKAPIRPAREGWLST